MARITTRNDRYARLLGADPECRRLLDDLRFGRLTLVSRRDPNVAAADVRVWDPDRPLETIGRARPRVRTGRAYARLGAAGSKLRPTWSWGQLEGYDFSGTVWEKVEGYYFLTVGLGLHEYLWGPTDGPLVMVQVGSAANRAQAEYLDPGEIGRTRWLTEMDYDVVFPVSRHRLTALAEWFVACGRLNRRRFAAAVRAVSAPHVTETYVHINKRGLAAPSPYGTCRANVTRTVVTLLKPCGRHAGAAAVSGPVDATVVPNWWQLTPPRVVVPYAELRADPGRLGQAVELADLAELVD